MGDRRGHRIAFLEADRTLFRGGDSIMSLWRHIVGFFMHPAEEWASVRARDLSMMQALGHILILGAIPVVNKLALRPGMSWQHLPRKSKVEAEAEDEDGRRSNHRRPPDRECQ